MVAGGCSGSGRGNRPLPCVEKDHGWGLRDFLRDLELEAARKQRAEAAPDGRVNGLRRLSPSRTRLRAGR